MWFVLGFWIDIQQMAKSKVLLMWLEKLLALMGKGIKNISLSPEEGSSSAFPDWW